MRRAFSSLAACNSHHLPTPPLCSPHLHNFSPFASISPTLTSPPHAMQPKSCVLSHAHHQLRAFKKQKYQIQWQWPRIGGSDINFEHTRPGGLHYKQQQAGCNTQWTQQKAGPVALLKPPSVNIHLSSMATHTGHSTRAFEVCRTPHPHEKTLASNIFCLHLCEI